MKIRGSFKSAPPSNVLRHTIKLKKTNIVYSLERSSLCIAVMIFNINLQVNNEYSDSATVLIRHANIKSEWIAIILFLLTVFLVFIMKTCTNFSPTFYGQANN